MVTAVAPGGEPLSVAMAVSPRLRGRVLDAVGRGVRNVPVEVWLGATPVERTALRLGPEQALRGGYLIASAQTDREGGFAFEALPIADVAVLLPPRYGGIHRELSLASGSSV